MTAARRRALSLITGLMLLMAQLGGPAWAREAVDPITTGSIGGGDIVTPATPLGSPAFRKALDVLARGDQVDAYNMAMGLPSDLERRTIQWAAIYYGNGTIDYHNVERFAADAPDFAPESVYRSRLEQSLVNGNPSDADVIKYLGGAMPNSIKGQMLLAAAYARSGQVARGARIARSIWTESSLGPDNEKLMLANLGSLLTRQDHWDRTVHLLMIDHASNVERMLKLLSPAQRSLATAGIAVINNASNAHDLLLKTDPSLRSSPVFYFLAAENARQTGDYARALADLNAPRGTLPDAPQWWYERRTLIRQILLKGDAQLAYQAAASYTDGPEGRLVEARFYSGWIALCFLNNAKAAKPQFEKMLTYSTLPDSITQGEYWLGRTLLALGDHKQAESAFNRATRYGTTYYGLLSRTALGEKPVELRAMPAWHGSEAAFEASDLVRAVRLLATNGQGELAAPLLRTFASHIKDPGQLVLAARLAQTIRAQFLAVEIADIADQRGTPLDLYSYPVDPLPPDMKLADIDKAAVYAVARQESRFRIDAISSSGARGLMQLMPATAKETAGKLGLAYSPSRLTSDGRYNALIGSTYLAGQLRQFDGSLALAAAAYNAGAGNAAKWVTAFGDPRAANIDPVVWVELIPFEETRRYVQRVLANYVIYRARLGSQTTVQQALRRIPD